MRILASILLLTGCSTVPYKTVDLPGGCHVNAVAFRDAAKAQRAIRDSKILIVRWPGVSTLHAYCAYSSGGWVYVYDNRSGSWRVSRDLRMLSDANRLAGAIDPATSGVFEE